MCAIIGIYSTSWGGFVLCHQAYRYRIYPNKRQQHLIHLTIGCCRYVFNHFLAQWNETHAATGKGLSYNTCAIGIPSLKKQFEWLRDIDSIALQSAVRNLADSFSRFLSKQSEAPRFKSRKNQVQSYTTRFTNGNISVIGNQLKLPKIGLVRFANSRPLEGRILSATVRRNAAGKYFVAIVCEVNIEPLPQATGEIGIDLGLKEFAVCSDRQHIANPKSYRKHEQKLALWQRRMARRKKVCAAICPNQSNLSCLR